MMLNAEASISVMDCVRIYDDLLSFDSEKISKKFLKRQKTPSCNYVHSKGGFFSGLAKGFG